MLTQVNPQEASPEGSFLANCRAYFGLAICICSSQLHLPRSKLKKGGPFSRKKKHRPHSSQSAKSVLISAPSGTRTLDK